jgi:hypothetical protein
LGLADKPSAEQLGQMIQRLEQDPWLKPEDALSAPPQQSIRLVARAGAFRGFGGPFIRPPTVLFSQDGLVASDGEGHWRVLADACGVVLLRDERAAKVFERPEFKIDRSGKVSWNDEMAHFPDLGEPVSQAGDGRTLAVTIASSHHVFLLAKSDWGL